MRLIRLIASRGLLFNIRLLLDAIYSRAFYHRFHLKDYTTGKFFIRLGYWPSLKNPTSFNEIIHYKKFHCSLKPIVIYADKFRVRKAVKEMGYGDILNDIFITVTDVKEIDFNKLPPAFVMKANFGSGLTKVYHQIDIEDICKTVNHWLSLDYNYTKKSTELHYNSIEKCIIFEKLMSNIDKSPLLDYKFYCFSGKVKFVSVTANINKVPLLFTFDVSWNGMPFSLYHKTPRIVIKKPSKLDKMIEIAENLSAKFNFVRIDLYLIDDSDIRFGEFTFFPGGGFLKFVPRQYDFLYGKDLLKDLI